MYHVSANNVFYQDSTLNFLKNTGSDKKLSDLSNLCIRVLYCGMYDSVVEIGARKAKKILENQHGVKNLRNSIFCPLFVRSMSVE